MVRNYKRVSGRKSWTKENMAAAIAAAGNGTPLKRAATEHGIPRNTLKRHFLSVKNGPNEQERSLGRYSVVFTNQQERELVNHILQMETMLFGVTPRETRSLAFQLAERNGISHPFDMETELAGHDWLYGFRKRHPELALRCPEATSAARAQAFNRVAVNGYFDALQEVMEKGKFSPSQIFNVDETCAMTVQTKRSKVLALKGRRQVGCLTSAERGVLSTASICMSASGQYLPPMLIFPRERLTDKLKVGAPPDTVFDCNSSGWMTLDAFNKWFDHFLKHIRPSPTNPVLLLLDGHASHTKNLAFLEKAKKNSVTVMSLPPHCSHKLQPLDVAFMGPLKTYFSQAQERFIKQHPGKVVTLNEISALLGEAFLLAATSSNAISGFKKTGIYPFNKFIFTDTEYAPSNVTDVVDVPDMPEACASMDVADASRIKWMDDVDLEPDCYGFDETGEEISSNVRPSVQNLPQNTGVEAPVPGTSFDPGNIPLQEKSIVTGGKKATRTLNNTEKEVCCVKQTTSKGFKITPAMIQPLPKVKDRRITKRRKEKATELTGEVYLSQLKAAQAEKDILQVNRATKRRRNPPKTTRPNKAKKGADKENLEDSLCSSCGLCFSSSQCGEGWSKCATCNSWYHECCGDDCPSCNQIDC